MAKRKVKESPTPAKKHYQNPSESWWGKAIVWILLIGMVGAIIVGFIFAVVGGQG